MDEKIFQRQLMKGELADMMEGGSRGGSKGGSGGDPGGAAKGVRGPQFTSEELRALFTLRRDTVCDTADLLRQKATPAGAASTWVRIHQSNLHRDRL